MGFPKQTNPGNSWEEGGGSTSLLGKTRSGQHFAEQGLYPLGCLPGSQSGIRLFMFESFVLWLKPAAEPLYRVRTGLSWVEGRDLTRAGPQSSWFQALQEVGVHSDGGSVFTSAFIFPVSAGQTENLINCVKPKQAWMLKDIK